MAARIDWERLTGVALDARKRAYAPYSRFKVGAALLADSGEIYGGCNVENASYGLCLCAERNALTTAVAAGQTRFRAVVVATGASPASPPCGMCLQVLSEFCVDIDILLVNPRGEQQRTKLSRLFKNPFRWKGAKPD